MVDVNIFIFQFAVLCIYKHELYLHSFVQWLSIISCWVHSNLN